MWVIESIPPIISANKLSAMNWVNKHESIYVVINKSAFIYKKGEKSAQIGVINKLRLIRFCNDAFSLDFTAPISTRIGIKTKVNTKETKKEQ